MSPVVLAADGSLYGTTPFFEAGGFSNVYGELYRIAPDGTFSVVHTFTGDEGLTPTGVTVGSDGNVYGTTGGWPHGGKAGAIYRTAPDGSGFTVLYQFTNSQDGDDPWAIVEAAPGKLYGVTVKGGASGGGTLYQLTISP